VSTRWCKHLPDQHRALIDADIETEAMDRPDVSLSKPSEPSKPAAHSMLGSDDVVDSLGSAACEDTNLHLCLRNDRHGAQ
jgi:hypothetical protein